MKEITFEKKVDQYVAKAKDDLATLSDDSIAGLSRIYEEWEDTAKKTAAGMNKKVGYGLKRYNAKVQDVANKVPGGFGKKVARYPWVTISMSLAIGLLVGGLFKFARQSVE